jgi:hypothetical protein
MNVISRLLKRYKQFGGFRLVLAYLRLGALTEFVRQGCAVLLRKRQIHEAYQAIQTKVVPSVRKRYQGLLEELIAQYSDNELEHEHNRKIWVCWLQGMEQAPEIVKVCHASLIQCLNDREVVVITSQNVNDYVTFPEHIQRKYDKGVIPIAQYSDLLRLELLTRYGGTWVDATVLCSGNVNGNLNLVEYLDAELFLYQYLGDRGTRFLGISNWFITASSNQKVLLILRDMLYEYWKDYNCVVAYFIFHIFFTMISERMPEEIEKMPRKNNKYCFYLEHKLGDEYDEAWMKELTKRCCFHKLNGRLWDEAVGKKNTFRDAVRGRYL